MKIFKILFFILSMVFVGGCFDLDANLFNTMKVLEYLGDEYPGETEIDLRNHPDYQIPERFIHYFNYSSGSETVYAVYLGDLQRINTDTVILYCHGNKHHMDVYWSRAKLLSHVGGKNRYGVLMMDYRGYGRSTGITTEEGMFEDVDNGMKWLENRGLESSRLVLYGYSLGTAAATELAAKPRTLTPEKLILEAPFASTSVMVEDASGLNLPASFFTTQKFNNADGIREVDQPFLWIHGEDDSFLSIKTHGEVVFKNYRGQRSISRRVPGGEHSDVPEVMGLDEYKNLVLEFILL